jgi:hypothetical protein
MFLRAKRQLTQLRQLGHWQNRPGLLYSMQSAVVASMRQLAALFFIKHERNTEPLTWLMHTQAGNALVIMAPLRTSE